jgi:hypothetical protein
MFPVQNEICSERLRRPNKIYGGNLQKKQKEQRKEGGGVVE